MSDLRELYQQVILDHKQESAKLPVSWSIRTGRPKVNNPLCGDHLNVFVKFEGDRIADIAFQGVRMRHFEGVGFPDDRCGQGPVNAGSGVAIPQVPTTIVTSDVSSQPDNGRYR